jgi:hypothetical protein
MAESFLEEQLQRIRDLTEQMSRVQSCAAEPTDELARRASGGLGPLHEVRDFRTYSNSDEATDRPSAAREHTRRRRIR